MTKAKLWLCLERLNHKQDRGGNLEGDYCHASVAEAKSWCGNSYGTTYKQYYDMDLKEDDCSTGFDKDNYDTSKALARFRKR